MDKLPDKSQFFFSKEAAEFLGISVQRLNKLTNEGRIVPFKKNSSGTIYHISELNRRRSELSIFSSVPYLSGGTGGMFRIDTPTKQEAVNLSSVMVALSCSERKVKGRFEELSKILDTSEPLVDRLDEWSSFFGIVPERLYDSYTASKSAFECLEKDDEIIRIGSPEYPSLLARTEEAPRFLYVRGNKSLLLDDRTVALVGSREASPEGIHNTERVASMLGRNGLIIVSGLAKGIDVTAHRVALENGYKTIAVIGTNLNQYYPMENKKIQKRIEKDGLVISQFSPALKTERWFFPLRNGVMSGLSSATVIMEAGETSGSLKQADFALKQGRLVLFPQSILNNTSITWPQHLMKRGAVVVKTPKEIIERLSASNIYKRCRNQESDLFDSDDIVVAEGEPVYVADNSEQD